MPQEEGMHRVGNPGVSTAVSVHLYGLQMARTTAGTTILPATTCAAAGKSDKTDVYSTAPELL